MYSSLLSITYDSLLSATWRRYGLCQVNTFDLKMQWKRGCQLVIAKHETRQSNVSGTINETSLIQMHFNGPPSEKRISVIGSRRAKISAFNHPGKQTGGSHLCVLIWVLEFLKLVKWKQWQKKTANIEIKPINQKYNLSYQINSIKIGVEKVEERNWWL